MSIAAQFESGERKKDRSHFRNLVLIAKSEGGIHPEEEKLLQKIGAKLNLTADQINEIKKEAATLGTNTPVNREDRFEQMVNLILMAHVDAKIGDAEMKVLEKAAVALGFKDLDDVDLESILALISRGEGVEGIMDELLY